MSDLAVQRLSAETPHDPGLALRDIMGMTKRNLLRIIRTPQLLVMSIVQPAIILLLFRYVLGGAIHVPGIDYVNYVVPGIFLEAVLIGGMTTSLAFAQDLQAGMIDRFRSLPMARSAFLAGDAGRPLPQRAGTVLHHRSRTPRRIPVQQYRRCLPRRHRADHFVRLRVHLGLRGRGLAVKDPQTAQLAAILPMFILFFASSAVVPVATMPGWLQPFARNQPASVVINSVRALFEGGPLSPELWQAIAWCLGIFVVFFFVSLNLYRKAEA